MWEEWEYEVSAWWLLWLGVASPVLRLVPVSVYGLVGAWILHGLLLTAVSWSPRVRSVVAWFLVPAIVAPFHDDIAGHILFIFGVRSILAAVFNRASKTTELRTISIASMTAARIGVQCKLRYTQRCFDKVFWGGQTVKYKDYYCPVCIRCPYDKIQKSVLVYLEEIVRGWQVYSDPGPEIFREGFTGIFDCYMNMRDVVCDWSQERILKDLDLLEHAMHHPNRLPTSFITFFVNLQGQSDLRKTTGQRFYTILIGIFESDTRALVLNIILEVLVCGHHRRFGQYQWSHTILASLPALLRRQPQIIYTASHFVAKFHRESLISDAQLRESLFSAGKSCHLHTICLLDGLRGYKRTELFVTEGLTTLIGVALRGMAERDKAEQLADSIEWQWIVRFQAGDKDLRRTLLRDAGAVGFLQKIYDRLDPQEDVFVFADSLAQLRRPLRPSLVDKLPSRLLASNRRAVFQLN